MEQEIFKTNKFVSVILPIIVAVVIIVLYFVVGDIPLWVLVFLIIPVMMVVAGQRTRLIVSDDMLRYEKVFGGEEVGLNRVSQIVTREVETIVEKDPDRSDRLRENERQGVNRHSNHGNQERKVEKIVYVLDESGRTFFSFPANLIALSSRQRFEKAITAANPKIDFF